MLLERRMDGLIADKGQKDKLANRLTKHVNIGWVKTICVTLNYHDMGARELECRGGDENAKANARVFSSMGQKEEELNRRYDVQREEIQRIKANNQDISHMEAFSTAVKNQYLGLRVNAILEEEENGSGPFVDIRSTLPRFSWRIEGDGESSIDFRERDYSVALLQCDTHSHVPRRSMSLQLRVNKPPLPNNTRVEPLVSGTQIDVPPRNFISLLNPNKYIGKYLKQVGAMQFLDYFRKSVTVRHAGSPYASLLRDAGYQCLYQLVYHLWRASPTKKDAFAILKAENDVDITYVGFCEALRQNIRVNSFTMKMEILLEPTSNKLMVEHAEYDESNTYVLERFNTTAGNPVKKILLKLNLSDHRLFKDGGGVKEFQRSFRHSDTERLSRSDEVLKLKNFKKDATLKTFNKSSKITSILQKSYADNRHKPLEFEVGDRVMLKVSPWKGVVRFGMKGKLALRYVGPFDILERIGPLAYRLRLPKELSGVHDTFHVSNLKKCLADASLHVPLNEIKVDKTLHFIEEPIEILDYEIKSLKCSKISLVKVCWDSKRGPEFT
ncbi:putative reverse transcriptase domain-containing protein [Tanacetum coccineum]